MGETRMLHCSYRRVIGVVTGFYISITWVVYWYYRGIRGKGKGVLDVCYRVVTGWLKGCLSLLPWTLTRILQDFTGILHGQHRSVTGLLHMCYIGVTGILQGDWKGLLYLYIKVLFAMWKSDQSHCIVFVLDLLDKFHKKTLSLGLLGGL